MKLKKLILITLILILFITPVYAENKPKHNLINDKDTLYLLAKIIHAEARGESLIGKVAVGAVIINRANSSQFPNSIEEVIYQPTAFTAVADGQFKLEPDSKSYQAALLALKGFDPTNGALFYYNPNKTTSEWIFSRPVIKQIGNHIFAQ